MSDTTQLHTDQIAYWNGPGGAHWVARQEHTDAMLAPVADAAIAHAAPRHGERVLDIGCGCGDTTLLLARAVGDTGHVTGLDVSAPMLSVARKRGRDAANITWVEADAATYAAETPLDLLFSRFGVMFFGDPVAAFANLRRSARPGARLVFACWRPMAENPWMYVPLHAAYDHVARLPKPAPEDPGPYAFADPVRVAHVLTAAGWSAPSFSKLDLDLDIAAGGGLEAAVEQATNVGAASRALQDAPDDVRKAATASIRGALRPYAAGNRVALAGAIWLVASARP